MKGKFNKRQKMMKNMSALLALAAGTLGLGMSEFGMMSVLSGAAADLNVSIPQAGHFVAAYALGVCAGALLLIFIARGRPLKKTLLVLAALMTAGNLLAALRRSLRITVCCWRCGSCRGCRTALFSASAASLPKRLRRRGAGRRRSAS